MSRQFRKNFKHEIHKVLDTVWQHEKNPRLRKAKRTMIYRYLSNAIGKEYHTADIQTWEEAQKIHAIIQDFRINNPPPSLTWLEVATITKKL